MDVAAQGNRVAVVEVQARRLRVELVHERLAWHHLLLGQRAIHLRRMPSVEVEGVRVGPLVDERHLQAIALGGPDRRTRHLAVIGPCRIEHAGRDLDLPVDGEDVVLTQ